MKKRFVLGLLLMLCTLSLTAAPAYPGRIIHTQPDGTTIGIRIHGDEFGHWVTDDAGRILEKDADGFWRVSTGITSRTLDELQDAASVQRAAAGQVRREYAARYAAANFGAPKIPVILIGFSGENEAFSYAAEDFYAMLNAENYVANNAVGSVRTYFRENSLEQFAPQFEVLGPVTLANPKSYYGGNGSNGKDVLPEMALVHAAQALDGEVDFSDYDNDGDGVVDFVMFYFAGYDEAQHGDSDCIWSHAWYLSSSKNARDQRTFDGVQLDRYFCTAELKGHSGNTMCSIGTTCHEFAHTLGLPDFYDANYATNGTAASMYDFDLMSSGNYNANSTTPPYLTAEELYEVGWLSAIPEMEASGSITLPAVNHPGATAYSAFKTRADVDGEYFVYEVRGGQRWDAPLPTGMLVYHVDKSSNLVLGSIRAASTWNNNSVNNYAAHPCCYVVPAVAPTQTDLYSGAAANLLFPGSGQVRSYVPTAWSGEETGFQLTNITYADQAVTFALTDTNVRGISGMVLDSDGNPLEGATVSFSTTAAASSSQARTASFGQGTISWVQKLFSPSETHLRSIQRAAVATVVTDSEGYYSAELAAGTYLVTAVLEGYVNRSVTVTVTSRIETCNLYLLREGEEVPSTLYAWPTDILISRYVVGYNRRSITVQNQYPVSRISRYAGKQIKNISFFLYDKEESATYEGVCVFIDYGNDRKATVPVSAENLVVGGVTTVDLRSQELVIPYNQDVYAGVGFSRGGVEERGYYYAFRYFPKKDNAWAVDWPYSGFISNYDLTSTGTRTDADAVFEFTLGIGDYEAPDTGYNYIADPKNGTYAAGDSFDLTLVETAGARKPGSEVAWYLDDEPVTGTSVTLTAGAHRVEARFATTEGKTKVIELSLVAE